MATVPQDFPHASSYVKIVSIIFFMYLPRNISAITQHRNVTPPAVIVFGDSVVDTGMNTYLSTIIKANFLPYGRDFMGGKPTGRFSNGKIPSDFTAELFGVKKILPPYLYPDLQIEDLLTGVSFASSGSGYDPLSAKVENVLSLSDQLNLFKEYKSKLNATVGEERTATIVSKSAFLVSAGSDDISNTYYSSKSLRQPYYSISAYTDFMIESASNFTQELYGLGARVITVLNLPPIGCLPLQRTLFGGKERACYEAENQAAVLFNSKFSTLLMSLSKRLPEAQLIYLDIYTILLSMIQNPAQYGFDVVDRGCCGTGFYEGAFFCNQDTIGTCTDASKFLFWDSFHPTETAYEMITSVAFKQGF